MKADIPDFLLEMSKQMREQPNRMTAHPIWQVRCKRFFPTAEGHGEHHWILYDCDGEFYRSDIDGDANEVLLERFPEFCENWEKSHDESFVDSFDVGWDDLPNELTKVHMQEIEEVVSTHLTEHDANWFIKRTQHNYPPLYTYVESAYWSPQLKQLQNWIIGLTSS